jgi:hypothetical protein
MSCDIINELYVGKTGPYLSVGLSDDVGKSQMR